MCTNLTFYKGKEVVRRQHMLPYCPQFRHCLFTSRWSRLLHRRLFSRHRRAAIRPSNICILDRLRIRTFTLQSSERGVWSKNYNDYDLRWIYCFHAWLRHGAYVASTTRVSLPRRALCRCTLYFGRRNLCRSLFERCSSGTSNHGADDSESSILFSSHHD